ncbi:MAG: N-methyl-D-aspartate receptor NMDAR2C subunit [Polyangiales bacterium]
MTASAHAELLADLARRYREPARHYHTLEHVAELLAWLEHLRAHALRPDLIAWAIWFHDAVYDPRGRHNEAESAALARTMLPQVGLDAKDCEAVAELVLATAHHHAREVVGDVALFLDLDLSILGAPAARYDAYTQQVRAEYAFVPDDVFREKRGGLLAAWLQRSRLYFTEVGHALFHAQAQANLARELVALDPMC